MINELEYKVIKRNGELVNFDREKIKIAISKAFNCRLEQPPQETISLIVERVIEEIKKVFVSFSPNVENVQDVVEKKLMEHGFYDVAKAYILYRKDHEKLRQKKKIEDLKKIEDNKLKIKKSSGRIEVFDESKIRRSFAHFIVGFEELVDLDFLVEQCKSYVYDGITTKEIERCMMMASRALIEQGMHYSFITSRILLSRIYKQTFRSKITYEDFINQYRTSFIDGINRGISEDILDKRLNEFDLKLLSEKIKPERDGIFNYLGLQTLSDRYFIRSIKTEEFIESPQAFWMRIAMGFSINEAKREEKTIEFYEILSMMDYVPSTPTLFHSGTTHPQLSSCYLTTVEDDLKHIFKCIGDNAQLAKWSGGIGNDWTNLRSTGSLIKGNRVPSNGIIPFLKIADDTTAAINRSGKRRGATCAYCETWHLDIEEFLELRKNTGDDRRRTHDMNTSNWIPDLFMKRVINNGDWTLFSPDEVGDLHHIYGREFEERYEFYERSAEKGEISKFKKMKARDLWRKMLTMLFETGHPWMTFKDPCNIRSPQDHVGVVHCSNLCTEITLNTSKDETAVCNLGSINLPNHIIDGDLNEAKLKKTVEVAMRMLDNVIDLNFYPTVEAKNSNLRHRPVGLGIMGFQDALYLKGVSFDSEDSLNFADESMEMISYYAILTSSNLAKERGTYESYKGSKWDRGIFPVDTIKLLEEERGIKIDVDRKGKMDWSVVRNFVKENGMRNSNCLAIAPTATIANIAGVFPSTEPAYKNIYVKSNQSGDFTVINNYLIEDLKRLNLFDFEMLGKIKYHDGNIQKINEIPKEIREKYKEVFEIGPIWLIKAAARRGKWIDQSQSTNIFYKGTSGKDLADIYVYAWQMGLKTTYYLRTLAASQVEKSTVDTIAYGVTHKRNADVQPNVSPQTNSGNQMMNLVVKPVISAQEKMSCSINAMLNGTECEACQ